MRSVRRSVQRLALGALALEARSSDDSGSDRDDAEDLDDDGDDDDDDESLEADLGLAAVRAGGVSLGFLQELRRAILDGTRAPGRELFVATRDLGKGLPAGTRLEVVERDPDGSCRARALRPAPGASELVSFLEDVDATRVPREDWTTQDVADLVVLPATRSGSSSPFFVTARGHGAGRRERGAAFQGAFVCHARQTRFGDLVGALEAHFADEDLAQTFVWIDIFSANLPLWERGDEAADDADADADADASDARAARAAFIRDGAWTLVRKFERMVVVVDRWDDPTVLRRSWCLWELFGGVQGGTAVEAAFAPGQAELFLKHLTGKSGGEVARALAAKVDARHAGTSAAFDRSCLDEAVAEELGVKGFVKVGAVAQEQRRKWLAQTARDAVERTRALAHEGSGAMAPLGRRFSTRLSVFSSRNTRKKKQLANLLTHTAQMLAGDATTLDEAAAMYEEAVAILKETSSPFDPETARVMQQTGTVYTLQGRFEEAMEVFAAAVDMLRESLGNMHPDVASSLNNLALLHSSLGQFDEALALFEEALEIQRGVLGRDHPDIADTLTNVALVYDSQGRFEVALELFGESLMVLEKAHGLRHAKVADALGNIALANQELGQFDKALQTYQAALEVSKEVRGARHASNAHLMSSIADVYHLQGRSDEAVLLYLDALRLYKDVQGPRNVHVSSTLSKIALIYMDTDRIKEALGLLIEALAVGIECLGDRHPKCGSICHNIGLAHHSLEDWPAALESFERAAAIFDEAFGSAHADTLASQAMLSECRDALAS